MMEPRTFAQYVHARSADDRTGLLSGADRFTWAEVVASARARARLAREMAVCSTAAPGRRRHIGILLGNSPEFVYWLLAAALSGDVAVGINSTRRGAELAADITHTDCDLIVTDAAYAALLAGLDTGVPDDRVLVTDQPSYELRLPSGPQPTPGPGGAAPGESATALRTPGSRHTAQPLGMDGHIAGQGTAQPEPADNLLLLFTSGSTGAPKAVVCSQGRLARIARTAAQMFGITDETVTYAAMPLFHGNAIMANLAPAVATGAAVALRPRFSASAFLADVRSYGVTYFNYVGRALAYVLATPERGDDAENPLALAFGTEASARDMTEFARRFGCTVVESYGSSEGAIAIQKAPGTPPSALGLPPEGVDVAICDPATGRECARAQLSEAGRLLNPGEAIGEIVGRNVATAFEGYYKNPAADAARTRGGWYWSGDLGYRDGAGYFYFAGRDADRLRVDSENFAAAPVERILARMRDVVMCAVYPVPDPRTGDQVMAAVELSPGCTFDPAEFAVFLAAQPDLGTKWAPRFVRVVAAMPLTATSKVDKATLRHGLWLAGDPVWWRPGRQDGYRPLTAADKIAIRGEFAAAGRAHLLPPPG